MRSTRRAFLAWGVPLGAALLAAARPAAVAAQSVTAETAPRYFRVEAQPGTDRKGRPIVWGYVYLHTKGQGSARVRLLVESLDEAGAGRALRGRALGRDGGPAGRREKRGSEGGRPRQEGVAGRGDERGSGAAQG